jgi:hypothetical protein
LATRCAPEQNLLDQPQEPAPDTAVARVNGEPIELREFQRMMLEKRSSVIQQFVGRGVRYSPTFWTSTYGGETPQDVVKKEALAALVDRKVRQIAFAEEGLLPNTTYSAFLVRWSAQNQRRSSSASDQSPIYGPHRMGEDEYFRYEFENAETSLKERLKHSMPEPTDQQLAQEYEADKNDLTRSLNRKIREIRFNYGAEQSEEPLAERRAHAERDAQQLRQQLQTGTATEAALAAFPRATSSIRTYSMDRSSIRRDRPDIVSEAVRGLAKGGVSDVLDTGYSIVLVRSIDDSSDYLSFADARSRLASRFFERSYDRLIADRAKAADVSVVDDVYASIAAH